MLNGLSYAAHPGQRHAQTGLDVCSGRGLATQRQFELGNRRLRPARLQQGVAEVGVRERIPGIEL